MFNIEVFSNGEWEPVKHGIMEDLKVLEIPYLDMAKEIAEVWTFAGYSVRIVMC